MSKSPGLKLHLCFPLSKRSHHHHDDDGRKQRRKAIIPDPSVTTIGAFLFDSDSDSLPEFTSNSAITTTPSSSSSSSFPDILATALSSRRFFFSPAHSNSLVEHPGRETGLFGGEKPEVVDGGVAIETYSPDPYRDFRVSMQEMVDAQDLDISTDWPYLQEMLACYLQLNSKRNHKYIVGAFADLLMSLMMGCRKTVRSSGGYVLLNES